MGRFSVVTPAKGGATMKKLVMVMAVVVGVFLLTSSITVAVECRTDADCNGSVGLSDLVLMKGEFMQTGCNPSTRCGRCNWPCYDMGGYCTFEVPLCMERCMTDPILMMNPMCMDMCMQLEMTFFEMMMYCEQFSY